MAMETDITQNRCGPGRPREYEESEALAAALDVFWRQGYEATSLEDLTQAMGLSRSSFYCCFGSKHGALMAAIRRYTDDSFAKLSEIAASESTPRTAVQAMIKAMSHPENGHRGCLLVNCITELAAHDSEVSQVTRSHLERVEKLLTDTIARQEPDRADDRARAIVSLTIGAITLCKAGMPTDKIEATLAQTEALLPRSQ